MKLEKKIMNKKIHKKVNEMNKSITKVIKVLSII